MSNILKPLTNQALRTTERFLDTPTIVYMGTSIPCTISTERRGLELQVGGHIQTVQMSLIVRRTAIATAALTMDSTLITMDSTIFTMDATSTTPEFKSRRRLTKGARVYRIASLVEDPTQTFIEVDLVDVNE